MVEHISSNLNVNYVYKCVCFCKLLFMASKRFIMASFQTSLELHILLAIRQMRHVVEFPHYTASCLISAVSQDV